MSSIYIPEHNSQPGELWFLDHLLLCKRKSSPACSRVNTKSVNISGWFYSWLGYSADICTELFTFVSQTVLYCNIASLKDGRRNSISVGLNRPPILKIYHL